MRSARAGQFLLPTFLLLLTSCAVDNQKERRATDAWKALADVRVTDGLTKELALDAFATLIGRIPGGEPKKNGDVPDYVSGTVAVRWLMGFLDELNPEQRKAARRAVLMSGRELSTFQLGVGPAAVEAVEPDPARAGIETTMLLVSAKFSERFPSFSLPAPELVLSDEEGDASFSAAPATRRDGVLDFDVNGPLDICVVTVYSEGVKLYEAVETGELPYWRLEAPLAHELFHCWQFRLASDVRGIAEWPMWLVEGSAAWAQYKYTYAETQLAYEQPLPGVRPSPAWLRYLGKNEGGNNESLKSLFAREYDAIGFFAHIENFGLDPWDVVRRMIRAGDEPDGRDRRAFDVPVSLGGDQFLQQWAMGLVRSTTLGRPWDTTGPGIPDYRPTLEQWAAERGSHLFVDPAAVFRGEITIGDREDRIILVGVYSFGAFYWKGSGRGVQETFSPPLGIPITDALYNRVYCLDSGGCSCPNGGLISDRYGELRPLPTPELEKIVLAFTGGSEQGLMRFDVRPVSDLCTRPNEEPENVERCTFLSEETLEAILQMDVDLLIADTFRGDSFCHWVPHAAVGRGDVLVGRRAPNPILRTADSFSRHLESQLGFECRRDDGAAMCTREDENLTILETWLAPDTAVAVHIHIYPSPEAPTTLKSRAGRIKVAQAIVRAIR